MEDIVVLVLLRNHFRYNYIDSGMRFCLSQAKSLADAGASCVIVLPKKDECAYRYEEKELPNWDDRFIVEYATLIKDHQTGVEAYNYDLLRLLTGKASKVPYDIVLNHNTPMAVGMHKPLTEIGFSRLKIPVISIIDNAASFDYYAKNPIGEREWHTYWETLEALSCMYEGAVVHNPYDYSVMRKQIKRMLSPSYALKALDNLHFLWSPVRPIVDRSKHLRPPKGSKYTVLLTGAFGAGRGEVQEQAETFIEMVKIAKALPSSSKIFDFVVCTNSPDNEASRKLMVGTDSLFTIHRNPSPEEYRRIFAQAHIGFNVRPMNDAFSLSLVELLLNSKPTLWLKTEYNHKIVDSKFCPFFISSVSGKEAYAVLMRIVSNYDKASELSHEYSSYLCEEVYNLGKYGKILKKILTDKYQELNQKFNHLSFKSYLQVFSGVEDMEDMLFDDMYSILNKKANGTFSLYSRTWVLSMLRKFNKKIFAVDGKLYVGNT